MKKITSFVLVICLLGIVSSNAYAHYLWVNVNNYNPEVGEEVILSLGWGHHFPEDGSIAADKLQKAYLISPEGKEIPLELKPEGEKEVVAPVKLKLDKPGTYLVVIEKKSGFVTKTTEGYKYQSKKRLKGVIKSYWSEANALAIINVGESTDEVFESVIKQRYQVIPLKNPNDLKEGDYLPVKIILDSKPYSSSMYATYEGFSDEKDTFAYAAETDKDGIAKIELLKKGTWLIKANDELPYTNTEEADVFSFTSTLTFSVK